MVKIAIFIFEPLKQTSSLNGKSNILFTIFNIVALGAEFFIAIGAFPVELSAHLV